MFRILVAEDDHAIRTLITTKLKQENYTIYTAENGEEALSVMEKHQVDLLISDIMMPVMDGYSLVKALRETKHTLPILMITAKSQLESLEEAFTLGVDDYMVKPIRLEELALRVRALLRRAQLETEKVLRFPHTKLDYNALTLTDIWGMEEDLDERLVDACIKRVRQKFKDNPDFDIVTIRGLGYKGTIKNG